MSARVAPRREPLAVALVIVNLVLAVMLVHRRMNRPARGVLPAGHPDVSVPSSPLATGTESEAPLALSGLVKLSPALKDPWPKGAYVFVIARPEEGGPPYAVRRYAGVTAPFAFALGPKNLMIPGMPAPAHLVLSVRVDQDGDALTRQLGDLESAPSAPAPPRGTAELIVDRPVTLAAGR